MKKITPTTNMGELVITYPELVPVLTNDYGLHCAGCMIASFDTLAQGAAMHGMSEKQIAKMIERLNKMISISNKVTKVT